MIKIEASITINKPVAEVYAYAADPTNAPLWYDNIKEANWMPGHALKQGAQVKFKASYIGKEVDIVYEMAQLLPNELVEMKSVQGPFALRTVYTFSPMTQDTTRINVLNEAAPKNVPKIMLGIIKGALQKALDKDLQHLKIILEND